jgi:hypothetical protein
MARPFARAYAARPPTNRRATSADKAASNACSWCASRRNVSGSASATPIAAQRSSCNIRAADAANSG